MISEIREIRKLGKTESETYFDGYVVRQDLGYGRYSKIRNSFESKHLVISRILSKISVI